MTLAVVQTSGRVLTSLRLARESAAQTIFHRPPCALSHHSLTSTELPHNDQYKMSGSSSDQHALANRDCLHRYHIAHTQPTASHANSLLQSAMHDEHAAAQCAPQFQVFGNDRLVYCALCGSRCNSIGLGRHAIVLHFSSGHWPLVPFLVPGSGS